MSGKLIPLVVLGAVVAAPGLATAQQLRTKGACAKIVRAPKRARCMACIDRKGVFHAAGAGPGACDIPSPAAKAAVTTAIAVRTKGGCLNRIANAAKRRRCLACVASGKVFHKWGGTLAGVCSAPGAVPANALPPPAPGLIVARAGCVQRVANPAKRQRCVTCVAAKKVFRPLAARGAGACSDRGAVAAGVAKAADKLDAIHLPVGCTNRVALAAKRARCLQCVKSGRVFHKHAAAGAGECAAKGTEPKAPVGAIFAPAGCRTRLAHKLKRKACLACVSGGKVYHKFANNSRGACQAK